MQINLIEYIRQAVICSLLCVALMMTALAAGMSVVFAQEEDLPPDIQVDIIMCSAKKDIVAERWKDAIQDFEKAMKLGVDLPGEFYYFYGKALFKTGSYEKSLSNLTNYLKLTGRDGEYYKKAIVLVVDAKEKQDKQNKPDKQDNPKQQRPLEAEHQRTEPVNETEKDMVFIKGGCFDMGDVFSDGSSDEGPVHKVCVDDFYLGKSEVTQEQWFDIVGNKPSKFKCGDCPVERVSWNDVQEFIKKLNQATSMNFRLPTEAEWEYAARNRGRMEKWAGAANKSELEKYAWYRNNSKKRTHPVDSKMPNGLGLYDMLGNVWEWCSDWYGEDYYKNSPSKNPEGPSSGYGRVIRGGGWRSRLGLLRTTARNDYAPNVNNFSNMGFRLARSP